MVIGQMNIQIKIINKTKEKEGKDLFTYFIDNFNIINDYRL